MPLPAAKKMSVCPFTSPSEGDRKSTRLNSSHSQISYAVFFFKKKTRLNSSHSQISYAVFCLKKKKKKNENNFAKRKKKNQLHSTEQHVNMRQQTNTAKCRKHH